MQVLKSGNSKILSLLCIWPLIFVITDKIDFRKLCQLDDGKFVLILWNTEERVYAVFYGMLPELKTQFQWDPMPSRIRLMNESQGLLIAVNYSTGLMATYSNDEQIVSKNE